MCFARHLTASNRYKPRGYLSDTCAVDNEALRHARGHLGAWSTRHSGSLHWNGGCTRVRSPVLEVWIALVFMRPLYSKVPVHFSAPECLPQKWNFDTYEPQWPR